MFKHGVALATTGVLMCGSAAAQCPSTATEFELAGLGGSVFSVEVFDLGGGPALYAAGTFNGAAGGVTARGVARWDGTAWSAFGVGTRFLVNSMTVFDAGSGPELYVAGEFDTIDGVAVENVARWDGAAWSAVGSPPITRVQDIVVHDDGAGPALWISDSGLIGATSKLARWDGAQWTSPAPDPGSPVPAMVSFDDGTGPALFVSTPSNQAGSLFTPGIARWDGTTWSALGAGIGHNVNALVAFDDGNGPALYAGGMFTMAGGVQAQYVARWRNGSWSSLGTGTSAPVRELSIMNTGAGPELHAITSAGIERWDGTGWSLAVPPDLSIRDAAAFGAAGSPVRIIAAGEGLVAGSRAIAAWDQGWHPLGNAQAGLHSGRAFQPIWLTHADFGLGKRLVAGGFLYGSGSVRSWDGTAWNDLASTELAPDSIYGFDGAPGQGLVMGTKHALGFPKVVLLRNGSWSSIGSGSGFSEMRSMKTMDLGGGPLLYVAGGFSSMGLAPASHVAAWDGTTWSPLGAGTNNPVYDIVEFDDGSGPVLIAGGNFTTAGASSAGRIASWDGVSWSTLGSGMDNYVAALAVFHGELYAGGEFSTAGGAPAAHVARWDGSQWSPLTSGLAGGTEPFFNRGKVSDMVVIGDSLYVAGDFDQAGGLTANNIARWDGQSWSSVGTGTDDPVTDLDVFDDGNGEALWLAGSFDVFNGTPSVGVARWADPCLFASSAAFCLGDDASCPCQNGGVGGGGCEIAQGTGGVQLDLTSQQSAGNTAVLNATGYPANGTPATILMRSAEFAESGSPFGDGIACLGGVVGLVDVAFAINGASTHPISHTGGPGVWYYQLRFRNTPLSFCDPTAAYNTSNAFKLTW